MTRVSAIRFTPGILILFCAATFAGTAFAEAVPGGFLVQHEMVIAAPPEKAYAALTTQIGAWWSPVHTWSKDARNLSIDARPGGCFCERYPDGGGVEHMRVVHVLPNRILRMTGALGPLQESGISGSMTWRLEGTPEGTTVHLAYSVGGFMEGGLANLQPAVNRVLLEQLQRFARFVETGSPETPEAGD